MKPRTKLQREVMRLSEHRLLPITPKQEAWMMSKTAPLYVISRNRHFCLECGHKWNDTTKRRKPLKYCTCPNCDTKLTYNIINDVNLQAYYMGVMNVIDNYQVVRIVLVKKHLKKNEACRYDIREVIQHWIKPDGTRQALMAPTSTFNGYVDAFCHGPLEPRYDTYSHQVRLELSPDYTYPDMELLPLYKRNGFNGDFYGYGPKEILHELINFPKFETLVKAKQHGLARRSMSRIVYHRWPQIKICIRNKYKVKDASMWADYIDLLAHYGKDLRNPKFICPKNIKRAHDTYLAMRDRDREILKEKDIKQRTIDYVKEKKRFFGIMIKHKDIEIRPLMSVDDFNKEAQELGHCVYSSKYFNRKHSLIMSAKIKGHSIETIEVDLDSLKVVQCRGKNNNPTEHHDQIVKLVENNLEVIAKAKINQLKTA
ncbi:MAG: PcfJ domain-containing protein [Bacteroidales bacterium]|jgi:hypothetical protein|nr:PcfJ domain-containing protein [Bacteroidales bacterium]